MSKKNSSIHARHTAVPKRCQRGWAEAQQSHSLSNLLQHSQCGGSKLRTKTSMHSVLLSGRAPFKCRRKGISGSGGASVVDAGDRSQLLGVPLKNTSQFELRRRFYNNWVTVKTFFKSWIKVFDNELCLEISVNCLLWKFVKYNRRLKNFQVSNGK